MFGGFRGKWPHKVNTSRKGNRPPQSPPISPPPRAQAQAGPPGTQPVAPPPPSTFDTPAPRPPLSKDGKLGIVVVGRFKDWPWGQFPDEAYMADALQTLGARVWRVDQDENVPPIKDAEVALFTGHPRSYLRMGAWAKTHYTCLWTLDWLPDFPDRQRTIDAAQEATIFLSSDQYDWRSRQLLNHGYLPGACETRTAPFSPHPAISCAFMGSIYNDRRKEISRIIRKHDGVVMDNSGEWVYGEDLSKFVQRVKVVVGDNARNDVKGYWSTRNYIIPGAGGFLLTPVVPGLDQQFTLGKHLAVYGDLDSLEGELRKWIRADVKREEIRRDGHAHVRAEHTWEHRAKALLVHLLQKVHVGS